MSHQAYIGFGSNLGDRKAVFQAALEALSASPGLVIRARSALYETEPVGIVDGGPRFINAAIGLETTLSPAEIMTVLHRIELVLGKSPDHRSDKSRSIDLDLLLYDEELFALDDGLEVPHPRMHDRAFVLIPLCEIAPDVRHPRLGCSVSTLVSRLSEIQVKGVRRSTDTSAAVA